MARISPPIPTPASGRRRDALRRAGLISVTLGLTLGLATLTGCRDNLASRRAPRTPYQRYQVLHGNASHKKQTNSFGQEQPALRQRLAPLDGS